MQSYPKIEASSFVRNQPLWKEIFQAVRAGWLEQWFAAKDRARHMSLSCKRRLVWHYGGQICFSIIHAFLVLLHQWSVCTDPEGLERAKAYLHVITALNHLPAGPQNLELEEDLWMFVSLRLLLQRLNAEIMADPSNSDSQDLLEPVSTLHSWLPIFHCRTCEISGELD